MTRLISRVVVAGVDDVTLEQVPAPVPGPGDVLIRSTVVGVCGSDMHAALGKHPFIDLPYRPGHEVVGVVTATGDGVSAVAVGDRIVVEPNLYCGECAQCRAGRYNICQKLEVFGCQTPGGLAELFTIPASRVHVLPDAMTDTEAALIEPLATPLGALDKAGDLRGRTVAVLGAGPIGLLLLVAARHRGASGVVVTDLLESKRARALRLGADAVFPADSTDLVERAGHTLGDPADVVFDCVSRGPSLAQAVDLVAKGGTVVVVGVGAAGTTPVRVDLIQDREIRLVGSLMYVPTPPRGQGVRRLVRPRTGQGAHHRGRGLRENQWTQSPQWTQETQRIQWTPWARTRPGWRSAEKWVTCSVASTRPRSAPS